MALPVVKVTPPSAISGLTAAQISRDNPKHLVHHIFAAVGKQYLNPTFLRCWVALALFCKQATGFDLSCAGQGSGWRSYQTQLNQFHLRYTPTWSLAVNGATNRFQNRRTFQGKVHYLRKGMIPVAVPGSGWHPFGLALDVAIFDPKLDDGFPIPGGVRSIRSNATVWNWLLANAASCGMSWEIERLGVDDPHLHYFAGDNVPKRVLDLEAFFNSLKA